MSADITDQWTVMPAPGLPELPALFLPHDRLPAKILNRLRPGRELIHHPKEPAGLLPPADPFMLHHGHDGHIRWCDSKPIPNHDGAYLLQPIPTPPPLTAPDHDWLNLVKSTGTVFIAAYTDIFLADYLAHEPDPPGPQILRFFETSRVGVIQVTTTPHP